jgi:hypothetical protein
VSAYKEKYFGTSQQNIDKYVSLFCGKPISRRCVGNNTDIGVDKCGALTGFGCSWYNF